MRAFQRGSSHVMILIILTIAGCFFLDSPHIYRELPYSLRHQFKDNYTNSENKLKENNTKR